MKTVKQRKKPAKPYRDFPLFLHATGQWAKPVTADTAWVGGDCGSAWSDPSATVTLPDGHPVRVVLTVPDLTEPVSGDVILSTNVTMAAPVVKGAAGSSLTGVTPAAVASGWPRG